MALFKKSYGASGDMSTEDIVKLLAPTVTPKPKANFLERILAPLQAIGSVPDIAYRRKYEGEKDFLAYPKNLLQGLKTAFTGEKPEREYKTTSDLIERSGLITGRDKGSRFLRGALGLVGDVVADPTTYMTAGTLSLGKAAAKEIAEGAVKNVAKRALTGAEAKTIAKMISTGYDDAAIGLLKNKGLETLISPLKKLVGEAGRDSMGNVVKKDASRIAKAIMEQSSSNINGDIIQTAVDLLEKKGVKGAVDDLYMLEGGRYGEFARSLADAAKSVKQGRYVKFDGGLFEGLLKKAGVNVKGLTVKNPYAVSALEMLANPLGKTASLGAEALQRVSPKTYEALAETAGRVFDINKYARQLGYGGAQQAARRIGEYEKNLPRYIQVQIGDLLTAARNLTQEEKERFIDIAENLPKVVNPEDKVENLARAWKKYNLPLRDEQIRRVIIPGAKDVSPVSFDEIIRKTESKFGGQTIRGEEKIFSPERISAMKKFSIETPEQFYKFMADTSNQQAFDGVSTYEKLRSALKLKPEELTDYTVKIGRMLRERAKETPYRPIEDYLLHDVLGLKEVYLEKKLGSKMWSEMKKNKQVIEDLKDGYVKAETINEIMKTNPFVKKRLVVKSPISALEESALAREFSTIREGEKYGVVYNKNIEDLFQKSAVRSNRAIALSKFIEEMPNIKDDLGRKMFFTEAEASDYFSGAIPPGYQKFSIKDIGSFYAPKDAVDIIKIYSDKFITDEGANLALKAFDTVMGKYIKPWFTAKGPAFIAYNIRNMVGDYFNMKIGGFKDERNILVGADVLRFENLAKKEGVEAAKKKYGEEIANYYDKAMEEGILKAGGTQLAEESGITQESVSKIGDLLKKGAGLKDRASGAWDYLTSAGGFFPAREETFRLAMFIDSYKQTGSFSDAAKKVREALFDYSELTPTEQNVFKRVIPFYSYMRKNFEFQLANMAKTPGKYTFLDHIIKNAKESIGEDVSEEEWNAMPDWIKNSAAIPIRNKEGDLTVLTGFGLPTEALNSVIGKTGPDTARQLISQSNPLLKYIIEKAVGYDTYADRPIKEQRYGGRYEKLPQFIKDLVGYKETTGYTRSGEPFQRKTVNPEIAHLLQSIPYTSSALTMAKRGAEASEDTVNLLNILSGARVYKRNVAQEAEARDREAKQALYDYLLNQGYGTMYQGFAIPKELRDDVLQRYYRGQ